MARSSKKADNSVLFDAFARFMSSPGFTGFVKDADGRYVAVSESYASLYGVSTPEEFVGKTDDEFISEEFREQHREDDGKVLTTGRCSESVLALNKGADGMIRYIRYKKNPIITADGNVGGIFGEFEDYSDIKEAQLHFDKQTAHYLRLPNNSLACAFIDVPDWEMISCTYRDRKDNVMPLDAKVDEFFALADRKVSSDNTAHSFFAGINRKDIIDEYRAGLPGGSAEFLVDDIKESRVLWLKFEYFFIINPANKHICIIFTVSDISTQRQEHEKLIRAAEQDSMTGLLNHESAMMYSERYINGEGKGLKSALFIIDVDDFKNINDRFGHVTGDNVLIDIAEKIRKHFRDSDIVGRIGGDEFFVLMKNVERSWTVTRKAKELSEALQYECTRDGCTIELTSSIGVTYFAGGQQSLSDLYAEADAALYRAKNSGKNRVMFNEDMDIEAFGIDIPDDISTEFSSPIHLKTILNEMDGTIFLVDVCERNMTILFASNPQYGQDIINQMPSSDYDSLIDAVDDAILRNVDLDYSFKLRMLNEESYRWIHLRGSKLESDKPGVDKMIIMATDITSFKNTEALLEASVTKNNLALTLSNVIVWEYDITTREIMLQTDSAVPLSKRRMLYISDEICYPESFSEYNDLYNSIEEGEKEGTEQIHFKNFFRKDTWMQVSFRTTFDESGHVTGALFAANDISTFMKSVSRYEKVERRYFAALKKNQSAFRLNLSRNTVIKADFRDDFIAPDASITQADEFLNASFKIFNGTKQRLDELKKIINVNRLLDILEKGEEIIEEDVLLDLPEGYAEWFRIRILLVKNPNTGESEAFCYYRNINTSHNSAIIIDKLFNFEYELVAVIDSRRGTINVLNARETVLNITKEKNTYEACLKDAMDGYVLENEVEICLEEMSLKNVAFELSRQEVLTLQYSVYGTANNDIQRKKYQFTYLDDQRRYIAFTKSDITDQYQSEFDPVAGLYSRQAFYRKTKDLINANPRITFAVIRWDIDKFKLFNDLFGVIAGDELLAMIGNAYRDRIKDKNLAIVANLGADHFALCMPVNDFNIAEESAFIDNLFDAAYPTYAINFHMAGYQVTNPSIEVGTMCDRAMIACKSIKDNATQRFIWYNDAMLEAFVQEQELMAEIKVALQYDQFECFVQPQFDQIRKKIVSGEVLVRWNHPTRGFVSPAKFIPILEKTELVTAVDQVVWEKTCQLQHKRLAAGKTVVPLAINISRRDFYNQHLCDILIGLVEKYELTPDLIDLEVTESAYIENGDTIIDIIKKLRNYGFHVKMDDFGSGYSSLNTLKNVPVDMLKLDLQFLTDEQDDEINARGGVIVDSILRMAHWLNLPVIAEGVETERQAEFLKTIDCALVQGFLFSKPLPAAEFESLLDEEPQDIDGVANVFEINNQFDEQAFWDPESQQNLIFNTFVGAAGIFEYYNNKISVMRLNDKFYDEIEMPYKSLDRKNFDLIRAVIPEDRPLFLNTVALASDSTDEFSLELRWRNFGRDISLNPLYLKVRMRRIARTDTRVVFYVTVDNITRRKNLEANNKELNTNLQSLFALAPGGLAMFEFTNDERVECTVFNNHLCRMFGYTEEEFREEVACDITSAIHPDDYDAINSCVNMHIDGSSFTTRCRHICHDGTYKRIIFSGSVKSDPATGKHIGSGIITEACD